MNININVRQEHVHQYKIIIYKLGFRKLTK